MFTESISSLMSQSSASSAQQRAASIEAMIAQFDQQQSQEIKPLDLNVKKSNKFSDILNSVPENGIKYKLAQPINDLSSDMPQKSAIIDIVKSASAKYKVDDQLLLAIIKQESNFNPNAVSSAGARGLMQLMPATSKKLGVTNPFSAVQNVNAGAKHMRGLLDKYRGNIILALAAYNAGGGNVDKYGGVPPFKETQSYVKNILSNYLSKKDGGDS